MFDQGTFWTIGRQVCRQIGKRVDGQRVQASEKLPTNCSIRLQGIMGCLGICRQVSTVRSLDIGSEISQRLIYISISNIIFICLF